MVLEIGIKANILEIMGWESSDIVRFEKSWSANVLPEKYFGLILKNKIATIANYFKIIKML